MFTACRSPGSATKAWRVRRSQWSQSDAEEGKEGIQKFPHSEDDKGTEGAEGDAEGNET